MADLGFVDTGDLAGFAIIAATLGEEDLLLALANTSELRSRGLMGVVNLGEVDGMVFVFDEPTVGRFWMKDVSIVLEIAFFDSDGSLIDVLTMPPCTTSEDASCERYGPGVAFTYAIERPEGGFAGLSDTDRLELPELFEE